MKTLLIVVAVLAILIGVAVFYIGSNLDGIVQGVIEKMGSEALGVEVSVGSVELNLKEGRGTIRDLEVANPSGFSRSPAMSFGELTLQLAGEAGGIKLVRAAAPEIRIESKGETNNIEQLLTGLESEPAAPEESEVTDESGEPFSLSIERIEIEAASAVLSSDQGDDPIDLQIEALVFQNLQGTAEEITSQIFDQLLSHISQAVKKAARQAVGDAVEEKVEEAKDGALQKLKDKFSEDGG